MSSAGRFIWYELMTTDTDAADAFYRAVIGWKMADSGLTDRSYTIIHAADVPVGGLMAIPPPARDAGAKPGWTGYIAVEDVDAVASLAAAAGGTIHHAATDIPGIGRFAVVADPQGAIFTLFRGMGEGPPAQTGFTPGHVGWHELRAADGPAAFGFYAALFGWTKSDAIDMGPMGIYQLFAIDGVAVGGMMTRMDQAIPPSWLYYFNVEEINAAVSRIQAQGGTVVNGPHAVPGGSWIVQGIDPQGALFAAVAPGA